MEGGGRGIGKEKRGQETQLKKEKRKKRREGSG